MDFQLNDEQRMWQEAIRNFAQTELKPRAAETDRSMQLPMDVIRKMAALGVLGLTVPEADGGPGFDTISMAIAIEEIARASVPHFPSPRTTVWAWGPLWRMARRNKKPAGCRN